MATADPLVLTNATRFESFHTRAHSRSPSRSPFRKAQFTAREVDPLLSNLSPDSTLKALQATATITSEGNGQNALAESIAEATPAEREIGIRAAIAAQKLREWHKEVSRWPWPARRDRGWGAGFLPPPGKSSNPEDTAEDVSYLGFLPALKVNACQDRIEDIRDGIEALELEDVKDHVFSAHVPRRTVSVPHNLEHSSGSQAAYGRMRDFTALVTATVIQALPELANLTMLLETWEIRFAVLRKIPEVTQSFSAMRAGIQTAFKVLRNVDTSPFVTMTEFETTKGILGGKVASLGRNIDKLLDMLEGQEDSLPKTWIDTLEDIEREYAVWAVEAEHVAIRNGLLSRTLSRRPSMDDDKLAQPDVPSPQKSAAKTKSKELVAVKVSPHTKRHRSNTAEALRNPNRQENSLGRKTVLHSSPAKKPTLTISLPGQGHNRGLSDMSVAESTLSAMSGLSAAEIVHAKSTQFVSSPKISVVESSSPTSQDDHSRFPTSAPDNHLSSRPPMIQRASTAAIEVVPKTSVRQVMLTRSRSHDVLKQSSHTMPPAIDLVETMPAVAIKSKRVSTSSEPLPEAETVHDKSNLSVPLTASPSVSPSPSLRVQPLQVRSRYIDLADADRPDLPRRSSKRLSQSFPTDEQSATIPVEDPASRHTEGHFLKQRLMTTRHNETLEAKIQDILETMPTIIRLAKESEAVETAYADSEPRSSTPGPSLTLSPVKPDRANKQVGPGDTRLFHLTRSGQRRDIPPVKLFVRAVGEHGERVMVRVGGGWADLAEYLREYSLHHGHRGLAEDGLEVANFPVQRNVPTSNLTTGAEPSQIVPTITAAKRVSFPGIASDVEESSTLNVNKVRRNGRGAGSTGISSRNAVIPRGPPPVPAIPTTYTMQSPTYTTTTANGVTRTGTFNPINSSLLGNARAVSAVPGSGGIDRATHSNSSQNGPIYTPLGAAGPINSGRHSTSRDTTPSTERESWVAEMIGKARAVSHTTTIQGPTITTTTTVISRSIPRNKRTSAIPNASNSSRSLSAAFDSPVVSPVPQPVRVDSSDSKYSQTSTRLRSRMSLGDVGGIRRVFLRRKSSEKSLR